MELGRWETWMVLSSREEDTQALVASVTMELSADRSINANCVVWTKIAYMPGVGNGAQTYVQPIARRENL